MRKPKTFKKMVKLNDDELSFGGYTVDMTETLIKEWIKFLESKSFKVESGYRVKWNQAKILREIFDIHD